MLNHQDEDVGDPGGGYFDTSYVPLVSQETRGTGISQQVEFIEKFVLAKFEQPVVLDLCCGHGRHLEALSRLGINLTGSDINEHFIKIARQRIDNDVNLICCDAREFVRDNLFDVVLNLETSLGCFTLSDAELVIANIYRSLKNGGALLLHVFNPDFAMYKLPHRTWFEGQEGIIALEERKFDPDRGLVTITQVRFSPLHTADVYRASNHQIRVMMFTYDDLCRMVTKAGFRIRHVYGDFKGSPYEDESPNIIMFCTKGEAG